MWKLWRMRNDPYLPCCMMAWLGIISVFCCVSWTLTMLARMIARALTSEWDQKAHLLGDAFVEDADNSTITKEDV